MEKRKESVGRWLAVVIDCPAPRALAVFYQQVLGLDVLEEADDWVTLGTADTCPTMAFQQTDNHRRPDWLRGAPPQQAHVDALVTDLDVAQARVLALGATLLKGSDKPIGFRVFADPDGHPFCLVTPEGHSLPIPE